MREQSHSFILDRAEFVSSAPLDRLVEQPSESLADFADRPTARDGPKPEQKLIWVSLMIAAAMALILWPSASLSYARRGLWVLFLVVSVIRAIAVFLSTTPPQTILSRRNRGRLPIYSIIVPLYKEANMVKQMVQNLQALNYPKKALDVIFAIEADDSQTLHALTKQRLPGWMRIIIAQGRSGHRRHAPGHAHHRLEGLCPARQRQRSQAGTLWPLQGRAARTAVPVVTKTV